MNKTNWLLGAFLGAMFFLACSNTNNSPSEGDSSSSGDIENSSSSIDNSGSSSSGNPSSSSSLTVVGDQDLVKKNITISLEKNYADIDGEAAAYTQSEAEDRLKKIDLIAFCGDEMGCRNNSIYNPWVINLFYSSTEYLGGYSYFYSIPDELASVFKTATKNSDIEPLIGDLWEILNNSEDIDEISIEEDNAFIVITSENDIFVVIINQANNQSVDLEIAGVPYFTAHD